MTMPRRHSSGDTHYRVWSRETVVRQLRKLGHFMSSVEVSRRNRSLVVYAYKYFGSWQKAMKAADLENPEKHWSGKEIRKMLLRLKRRDGYVNCVNLRTVSRLGYPSFLKEVYRIFGSIRGIQESVGLPPTRGLTREEVRAALQSRLERNASFSTTVIQKSFKALYRSACRQYGSWKAALLECGIPESKLPMHRTWTDASLLSEIYSHWQAGHDLRWESIGRIDRSLAATAQRTFGRWILACWAADVPLTHLRK